MCGIAGIWIHGGAGEAELLRRVRPMGAALAHRGPDNADEWTSPLMGLALAHRRLAVVDLTPEGRQPMHSADGRYVLVFNGEIYNQAELRAALPDMVWRGTSDTEVLLAAISRWGLPDALARSVGMFALALWDVRDKYLYLARDRFGEKPLYYGRCDKTFLFGSELKALTAFPGWTGRVDPAVLSLYLRLGCVPAPYSIWQGIQKLPAGTWLRVEDCTVCPDGPQAYWSASAAAEAARRDPFPDDPVVATNELEQLLRRVVGGQQVSDVPLGAFLSGGIDSSLIVALMQSLSRRPVRTFTIGFRESGFDEAPFARQVASHLGTDHTELYVTPEEARAVIPRLATIYDEPFADSSQIPTCLVAGLARRHVTVALSGDGGDEMFGGYNRHVVAPALWRWPPVARRMAAGLVGTLPPNRWDAVAPLLPARRRHASLGDKLYKVAALARCDTKEQLYRRLITCWQEIPSLFDEDELSHPWLADWRGDWSVAEAMMLADARGYLSDDIMAKVDRATMAASLESRAPFLDHRVFEFAWRLPETLRIRGRQGKWLLRQLLYRYVPKELVERPKTGFGVPIDAWLRGPLREWADSLLSEERLRGEGWFQPEPIRRAWAEHLSGRRNWQHQLWTVLMFQAWQERWL
jgi:asparagine synthase (glutamine-hydrolysing)